MLLALHTGVFKSTDVVADIETAKSAGFAGAELQIDKLEVHFGATRGACDIREKAGALQVTMLDALLSIERTDPAFRDALNERCGRVAAIAKSLDCPFLQVVALDAFGSSDRAAMRRQLRGPLSDLVAIASSYGVRLALEQVCFSPFHTLDEAVALVWDLGPDRLRLVLDTWHLWTSGTSWRSVADLDPRVIACAHIGDSLPRAGKRWCDDDRAAIPGEGIVPLEEAIAAIKDTGFNGFWTVEVFGDRFGTWEPVALAQKLYEGAARCLELSSGRKATNRGPNR